MLDGRSAWSVCMVVLHGVLHGVLRNGVFHGIEIKGSCRKGHTWSTFAFKGIRLNGTHWSTYSCSEGRASPAPGRTLATSSLSSGSGTFVCECARCRLSGAFQALFRTFAACMSPLSAARVEHAFQFRAVTGPRQNKHCRTRIILPYRDRSTTKQTQVRVPTRPRPRAAQERPTHDLRRSGQRTTGRTASPARCASGGMVLSRVNQYPDRRIQERVVETERAIACRP